MTTALRIRRHRSSNVATRVTAIPYAVARADTSRQVNEEDVITSLVSMGTAALIPPYKTDFLYACVERSNMLKQCIAAMVTNTALCGFEIVPIRPGVEIDDAEKEELESFIEAANSEESLTTVHAKVTDDYETYGYGFIEVVRDRKGRMSLWRHAKAIKTLLTVKDDDPQVVQYTINRGRRQSTVTELRCFRKYVQVVSGNTRYFKEFGDPRTMNMLTGKYEDCSQAEEATEIFHIRQNSNDAYGTPKWINQLPSILGSRESEECNLRYFEENTIPPMIMSVSGGRLTKQSYQELTNILTKQGLGQERQHKLILIEAVPERDSLDDKGTVTLRLDKLTDARQSDGLFKDYDEGNQAKVRSSFRLPPVAVGLSQDVTFACYDERTETLTDHGWVTVDTWRAGMRVACYNQESHCIEYHEPDGGLLVYDVVDTEMYKIATEQVDQCVTPNHRMLFSSSKEGEWRVEPIDSMAERHRVFFRTAASYDGGVYRSIFTVPTSNCRGGIAVLDPDVGTVDMSLILEWVGYYIADGCIAQKGNAIRIGARKERKVLRFADLHELLQDAGFRVRSSVEPAGTYYTVSHKGFAGWLARNAGEGSSNKRIPDFIWKLCSDQLQVLFDALMAGDGTWDCRNGRTSGSYSTVSLQLANDVQRLAFLLGYRTALREDRPGSFSDKTTYRVLLARRETCQVYPGRHITRETYTGRVYCFSVPTGIFVTRRNGKVAIQGNTANVSAFIAESQVYLPQRKVFDELYNKHFVNNELGLGLTTCKLVSKVPLTSNSETIIKSLTALNVMGAITPRMANILANKTLQVDVDPYPEPGQDGYEEWMDKPIIFVSKGTASDAGQNQKDPATKAIEGGAGPGMQQPENGQQ